MRMCGQRGGERGDVTVKGTVRTRGASAPPVEKGKNSTLSELVTEGTLTFIKWSNGVFIFLLHDSLLRETYFTSLINIRSWYNYVRIKLIKGLCSHPYKELAFSLNPFFFNFIFVSIILFFYLVNVLEMHSK